MPTVKKGSDMFQYITSNISIQFLFSILIKWDYMELECTSLASVNNSQTIYNQNQEPNLIGNILLTLDSKRPFLVLTLCILLSYNKRLDDGVSVKNRIRNKKLEVIKVINWKFLNTQRCTEEIGNKNWNVCP